LNQPLSNYCKVDKKKMKTITSWMKKYRDRNGLNADKDGITKSQKMIPHYTGVIQYCKFPLSEVYCKQI
jgi:hypothetical protein